MKPIARCPSLCEMTEANSSAESPHTNTHTPDKADGAEQQQSYKESVDDPAAENTDPRQQSPR